MRLEQMTVHLRARSAWEAVELGTALVRRDAATLWKAWVLVVLPLFVALNAIAWALEAMWLGWVSILWLKPALDRIPLYVISRSVFGAAPGVRETLRAQLGWGWGPVLHYLTWRRFSPARSLMMPIELLEGVKGARLRERRRVLGGAVYGNAALLTCVFLCFQTALVVACLFLILMFVQPEYLPETVRAGWAMIGQRTPWWAMLAWNFFVTVAMSVVEPFFVGAGFGLYLNRRTQIEAWDVEIAFRKLRARLAAAAAPFALALLMVGAGLPMLRAQEATPEPGSSEAFTCPLPVVEKATPSQARKPPTLPVVFGKSRVDEGRFDKAVDQAYRDPLLNAKYTQVAWEKRDKTKPKPARQRDMSWLAGLATGFAFLAEWGLWILVAVLVAVLLLTARHWLPWMGGSLRRRKPLPVEVETESLQLPESLPDNVPAEARRLWARGKPRHALALLYRASVETMAQRAEVVLPPGATESECLRASRRMPDGEDRSLFARMVRVWQHAAYAQRLPAADEFEALLSQLQLRYRWPA
ncbi:MAG: DUF4129 domain-containing protein [Pseudoxanthomonas sp.]